MRLKDVQEDPYRKKKMPDPDAPFHTSHSEQIRVLCRWRVE
jgi:hypothetical protein